MKEESKQSHTPEILLVDKPTGISSFDVIRRLRRVFGVRKMGHAGTLDPRASGLMIIGIEAGTKRLNEYIKLPKTYGVEILLGESRSTGDLEGGVLEKRDVPVLAEAEVRNVIESMKGVHTLPVPAYSAVKRDGVRLYKRARGGQKIEDLPLREMEVYEAMHSGCSCVDGQCTVRATFHVASGVYIRSLSEEVGRRLGYPATTAALRRTRVGEFSVSQAHTLTELEK